MNTLDQTGTCKQGLFYYEHSRSDMDMYIKVNSTYYEYVRSDRDIYNRLFLVDQTGKCTQG